MTHPDILRIEATGYGEPPPDLIYVCSCCGEGIFEGEKIYEIQGCVLCRDCVESSVRYA